MLAEGYFEPLLAILSIPIHSSADAFEAIKSYLSWQFGEDWIVLRAVSMLSTTQALVFINSNRMMERLVAEDTIQLNDSLSVSFHKTKDVDTKYISVDFAPEAQFTIVNSIQNLIMEQSLMTVNASSLVYCRKGNAVVICPSVDNAIATEQKIANISGVQATGIIKACNHCVIDCFWNSDVPLAEIILRLKRSGESLIALTNSSLCLLEDQPCILDISPLPNTISSGNRVANLVIICCTSRDADILYNLGSIAIGPIASIDILRGESFEELNLNGNERESYDSILTEETDTAESETSRMKQSPYPAFDDFPHSRLLYIFWDIDYCQLVSNSQNHGQTEDDVYLVSKNIEAILHEMVENKWKLVTFPDTKYIYVAQDGDKAYKPTSKQAQDFVALNYRVVNYLKKSGDSIRPEIELMIKKHQHEDLKPVVCLISGDKDFGFTLNTLKSVGFQDVLLIHNSSASKSFVNLAPRAVPWSHVRLYHSLSPAERMQLHSFSGKYECLSNPAAVAFIESSGSDQPNEESAYDQNSLTRVVTISRFSIATHLNSLMQWRNTAIATGTVDMSSIAEDDFISCEPACHVEVVIERERRKQRAVVTGMNADAVARKTAAVSNTVDTLVRNRKVQRMYGWKAQHRLAIMGSALLLKAGHEMLTTVVFHVVDGHIVAEAVSMIPSQVEKMFQFLEALIPEEAEWRFDSKSCKFPDSKNVRFWNSLRHRYAVMFDKVVKDKIVEVKAWGFGSLVEESHQFLISATNPTAPPLTPTQQMQFPEASPFVSNMTKTAAFSMFDNHSRSEESLSSLTAATFKFREREACHFYQSFEGMFQRYLENNFHVSVKPIKIPPEEGTGSTKNAMIVLELTGAKENIDKALKYLEGVRSRLTCRPVAFARVDGKKYKEINDLKESCIRTVNLESAMYASSNADPLDCPGLVSIRVKPPLHSRGIKRMTFPADATVFICESTSPGLVASSRIFSPLASMHSKVENIVQKFSLLRDKSGTTETPLPSPKPAPVHHGTQSQYLSSQPPTPQGLGIGNAFSLSDRLGLSSRVPPINTSDFEEAKLWLTHSPGGDIHTTSESVPGSVSNTPMFKKSYTDAVKSEPSFASFISPSGTFKEPPKEVQPSIPLDFKKCVHWPHSSFRYMFLSNYMKTFLNKITQEMKEKYGDNLTVTCPYRDKKDASVCMLVSATHQSMVDEAIARFDEMLQFVLTKLMCVQVILSKNQYEKLTELDLERVKAIQGSAGVHMILAPSSTDVQTATETQDFRFIDIYPKSNVIAPPGYPQASSRSIDYSGGNVDDLVKAHISSFNKRIVDVSVMTTSAESAGWTWGVNCLLVFLERDSDVGLSDIEISKLNHGDVLVTTDYNSGKTILRARANLSRSAHAPYGATLETMLMNVISRGLLQADMLNITGVAIVPPDTLSDFSNLAFSTIQAMTISSVVEHIISHQVFHLERIVCLDILRNVDRRVVQAGSMMAAALCDVVQNSNDCRISVCNDPYAAMSLKDNVKCLGIAPDSREPHVLILKGIHECIQQAYREIDDVIVE